MRPAPASATLQPLDLLLGTPALVRVARVLTSHGGALAIPDLARRARLALPSTREAVRRLADVAFVEIIGAGRSSICAIRPEHPMAAAVAALFAAERAQADALLDGLREAAASLHPAPVAFWLYGSVARGEDGPTSDIDLAVVTAGDDATALSEALREALASSVPLHADRMSVIGFTVTDAARLARDGAPIWGELAREAVVLAGESPADVLERAGTPAETRP
jgi:predicted nucleotidyltransferase